MMQKDEILIRFAGLTDSTFVAELEKMCFSAPWSLQSIEYAVSDSDSIFLIAEINGKKAGYISGKNIVGELYINNIAVDTTFRSKGIGNRLLSRMCCIAKEKGCETVTLEVRQSNQTAISLYKKNGFEQVGLRKNYYSEPSENALILTKII